MKRTRLTSVVVALLLCLLIIAGGGFAYWRSYLHRPLPITAPVIIDIRAGMSLRQVNALLAQQAGLAHPRLLALWAQQQGLDRAIRRGEFAISPGMTPQSALGHLISGQAIQYPVTFIEGTTVREALNTLWTSPKVENLLASADDATILEALESPYETLEGLLFPDTYFYTAGTSDLDILRRAQRRLAQVLDQEWESRADNLPLQSPYEALILASIIEKESGLVSERERIAGVFVRRLQRGMRLQSDPTVIYGMGESFDGNLRRVDLETSTPYNTYRINGLPPSPIAMAGRDAIHASLHPAEEDVLYFVATGDGGHYFSVSLDEHNAAVRRYQQTR